MDLRSICFGAALLAIPALASAQKTIHDYTEFDSGDLQYRTHTYLHFLALDAPSVVMVPGDGLSGKTFRRRPGGLDGWGKLLFQRGYNTFMLDNVGVGSALPPPSDDIVPLIEKGLFGVYQVGVATQPAIMIAHEYAAGMALKARSIDERVAKSFVLIDPYGPQYAQPMTEITPEELVERNRDRESWKWTSWGFGPERGVTRENLDLSPALAESLIAVYEADTPPFWVGMLTDFDTSLEVREAMFLENIPVLVIRTPAADAEQIERENAVVEWMIERGMQVERIDLSQDEIYRNVSGLPWAGDLAEGVLNEILDWYTGLERFRFQRGDDVADCVFDIETAPLPDAEIPPAFVEKLRSGENDDSESWREFLGLYAISARVIVIGMLNPDSGRGVLLYDNEHGELGDLDLPDNTDFTLTGGSEAEILDRFWTQVAQFRRVITYNGRGFDVPFLMQRSLVREVPVRTNLMPPRFRLDMNHLDLQEVLSMFRATRPYGLAPWTQAIGAASPKEGSVAGAEVGDAFAAGRTGEIAAYCARDVVATAKLAEKVLRLWAPIVGR